MIFDTQMHVGSIFGESFDADGLRRTMREHDISAGMVFSPDNNCVKATIEVVPEAWGLAWVNPHMPDYLEQTQELLDHPRFLGVKLHPVYDGFHPNDPAVHAIVELLLERNLPLLIHCGHPIFSLPWSIEELIASSPDLNVIVGHMGHCKAVYIDATIAIAERNENVYLDTSGMQMPAKISEAASRIGARRILFGSDLPSHHPAVEIAKVRVSGLSDAEVDQVLARNGRRLFFGDENVNRPLARNGGGDRTSHAPVTLEGATLAKGTAAVSRGERGRQ
jgi:predicted TIM-barrel fold metal-dependent hydrolase